MSALRGGPAGGGLRARFGGGPRRATGPGEPAPGARPRSYRDATLMINRSREDYLALGIILLAIGGDIAAFYVVLARVFRGSPFLIVLGHRRLRRRRRGARAPRGPGPGPPALRRPPRVRPRSRSSPP